MYFFPGASSCNICPEGYQCIRGILPDPCPLGYYCPKGTGYDIQPCPVGTFGNVTNLKQRSDCSQCSGGHYCEVAGKATVTGKCKPGKLQIVENNSEA